MDEGEKRGGGEWEKKREYSGGKILNLTKHGVTLIQDLKSIS